MYQLDRLLIPGIAAPLKADLYDALAACFRRHNPATFLDREAHGLLAVHVLASRDRIEIHRSMQVTGHRDDNGVKVVPGEQIAVVCRPGGVAFGLFRVRFLHDSERALQMLLLDVTDGRDFYSRHRYRHLQKPRTAPADTDEPTPHTLRRRFLRERATAEPDGQPCRRRAHHEAAT